MSGVAKTTMHKAAKMAGRGAKKVVHPPFLRSFINAGMASPAPPLGPNLGQRGANVGQFCKYFNERTKDIIEGIPLPCRIWIKSDRSFDIQINQPPNSYFLKMAAGCEKGRSGGDEVAGIITVKHIYEIAKIKKQDPLLRNKSMESLCNMILASAQTIGIKVVHSITPDELGAFLEQRSHDIVEKRRLLDEQKTAKLMRV